MTDAQGNSGVSKKWPADNADSTADKILIRMDCGFDPDFICVEACDICGPSGVLLSGTSF
jgi:hypothetical protein